MSVGPQIEIYVIGHDWIEAPQSKIFKLIQVGAANSLFDLGHLRDDTGTNISRLNQFYAELTAMYWVWKNTSDQDYIGFFHYRRFLNFGLEFEVEKHWTERNFHDFSSATAFRHGWTNSAISAACNNVDIIAPYKDNIKHPANWTDDSYLYEHYVAEHVARDFDLAIDAAKKHSPPDLVDEVMMAKSAVYCNMFIMRRSLFDEYMSWIFSVFSDIEKEIYTQEPIYAGGSWYSRTYGFIGERFFNIFIESKRNEGLKIDERQILFGLLPGCRSALRPLKSKLIAKALRNFGSVRTGLSALEVNLLGARLRIRKPY